MEVNGASSTAQALPVQDGTAVGSARRAAVALAEASGAPEAVTARVALVATELATNLVRHGGGGTLIVQRSADEPGLELVALDRGPGISRLEEALRDGFSTGGTPGTGLGAVTRMADHCEVFSAPGLGTIVLARFAIGRGGRTREGAVTVGGISLPCPGETVCGDAWAARAVGDRVVLMVVDGLGHGSAAAAAANEAVRLFVERVQVPAEQLMAEVHDALRPTRGAAVGIATIHVGSGRLGFVGVGNISGIVQRDGESRSLVSHAGIVGHQCRRIQEFAYPWASGNLLMLYSDGLQTRWQLSRYPGLTERHPTIVAAALYRDHVRGRDDVTVVAAREAA
jgi:anti-sigma regulatory factor (Ser/Thr protein kinase)